MNAHSAGYVIRMILISKINLIILSNTHSLFYIHDTGIYNIGLTINNTLLFIVAKG